MSLKGTQPLSALGSHCVFRPSAARICRARRTHPPAPTAGLLKKFASDGFRPEGRKKLTSAAETHVGFSGSLSAARQFASRAAGFTAFTLIGRFRWRPPLKLYSTLSERSRPSSRSKVRLAWFEYAYWKFFALGNPNG